MILPTTSELMSARTMSAANLSDDEEELVPSEAPSEADEVTEYLAKEISAHQIHEKENVKALCPRYESLPGNLYYFLAFRGPLQIATLKNRNTREKFIFFMGCAFVMMVQVIGPPAVLVWGVFATKSSWDKVQWFKVPGDFKYEYGSFEYGVSNLSKRIMSMLFMVLFLLSAIYDTHKKRKNAEKLYRLAVVMSNRHVHTSLDEHECTKDSELQKPSIKWLYLHAMINGYVLCVSALALGPVFMVSENPRDVILDAFGLAILYRLDETGSELGFIDVEWPKEFMAKLYNGLPRTLDHESFHNSALMACITPDRILLAAEAFLWIMLFVLPVVFASLSGIEWNEEVWEHEIQNSVQKLWQGHAAKLGPFTVKEG